MPSSPYSNAPSSRPSRSARGGLNSHGISASLQFSSLFSALLTVSGAFPIVIAAAPLVCRWVARMVEPSYHDLLQENQQLRQQLATALGQIADLQAQVTQLAGALEEARRAGKRQAAPFRNGPPKAQPKNPGRKSGDPHGRHGHRPPPAAGQIDEVLEASQPDACPCCGGPLLETTIAQQ